VRGRYLMSADTRISVVIVRWKNGPELGRCLDSLLSGGADSGTEIIVVDSGSGDGGAKVIRREYPGVRVLELEENLGFAVSANRGAAMSSRPFLTLLNPDTVVPEGALVEMAGKLESGRAAGVVPLLETPGGDSQARWQLRRLPTLWDLCRGRSGAPVFRSSLPVAGMDIPQPAAAAWMLRRNIWEGLGGFDERFRPAWFEDVDFCFRLRAGIDAGEMERGFQLLTDVRVLHEGASSLHRLRKAEFVGIYLRNLLLFARIHFPGRAAFIAACIRWKIRLLALRNPELRPLVREIDGSAGGRSDLE